MADKRARLRGKYNSHFMLACPRKLQRHIAALKKAWEKYFCLQVSHSFYSCDTCRHIFIFMTFILVGTVEFMPWQRHEFAKNIICAFCSLVRENCSGTLPPL
ncbi:MAG: hypothetical protein DBX61_09045 [Clostridiales bacterium]|nr:MAG: hypothetical protein DBX61_09045 [Clostridiales bacterium]